MTRTLQLLRALASSRAALAPAASPGGAASLAAAPAGAAASRGLRGSAAAQGIGSHMSDNDPVVLELEKRRNLSADKTLPGGGGVPDVEGWNEALASDSEAVVKAERSTVTKMESITEFTIKRNRDQNHDPIIAEEEAAAAADPHGASR